MGPSDDLDDLWERAPSRPRRRRSTGSEAERLHRIARGDPRAAAGLLERHLGPSWHLALVMTADAQTAARAVVEAWEAIHGHRPKDFHLALLDAVRNRAAALSVGADPAADVVATVRDRAAVLADFLALPVAQRTAWWLHNVEALPLEVVSVQIGIGPVRTRETLQGMDVAVRDAMVAALSEGADGDCRRAAVRFGPYLEGTLGRNDLRLLHRHVQECAACASRLDAVEDPAGALLELMPVPPDDLRDEVRHVLVPVR